MAWDGVVHRGRHHRLFRVFGSFDHAIDAVREDLRWPVLAPDRRTASGRISGGLALPRDVEWCATRRCSEPLALQYLPEPAGQVCRDDTPARLQPWRPATALSTVYAAAQGRLEAGEERTAGRDPADAPGTAATPLPR